MPTEKNKIFKNKVIRDIFRFKGFRASFKIAVRGLTYLFLYHRNMRLIFLLGLFSILLGFYFNLKGIELIALSITVTLVFMAEIFNTAVELMMDTTAEKYNTKIRLIKDIAAGIVVITCLNALLIGYVLFIRKIPYVFAEIPTPAQIIRSEELIQQDEAWRKKIKEDRFYISKILVKGVRALSEKDLREILVPFEKKWLTAYDIQEIIDRISDAYEENGIFKEELEIDFEVKKKVLEITVKEP